MAARNTPAPRIEWRLVEPIVLILFVIVVLFLLARGGRLLGRLIVNGIVGLILLFLTNLVLAEGAARTHAGGVKKLRRT